MKKIQILFLYTELASYFLACVKALQANHPVEIHIVKWPLNQEAPFDFDFKENIFFYDRKAFSKRDLLKLTEKISPDIIYCSGWIDKDYLQVCKKNKQAIPVVVGLDNQWKGSFKQWLAVLTSSFTLHPYFTHAWIPGAKQHTYAKKLGFEEDHILKGFYSADFNLFYNYHLKNKKSKQEHFPKRFIYVGRYIEHKGIKDLWKSFIELQQDQQNDWELWCLGTGPLISQSPEHPKIKHFGFVQPSQMERFIAETGVFVLPSHFEPWGVVVHEFAAAGFPLICSDKVGASSIFLQEGVNGHVYPSGNGDALKEALRKMMNCRNGELFEMSEQSVEKARLITPEKWAETLIKVL